MALAPFPWRSLDSLRGADVLAMSGMRRSLASLIETSLLAEAMASLLGVHVEARLRSVSERASFGKGGVAVVLTRPDIPSAPHVVVEVEPLLGAALVTRALRRKAPRILDPKKVATEPIAGAVGAILVAAARRAGAPMHVVAAGAADTILTAHLGGRRVVASFTVIVEYDAFVAHVILPWSSTVSAATKAFDGSALRSLGEVPVALSVVASVALSTVAEVASLQPGDAWMTRSSTLRLVGGAWVGEVYLVAPLAERGVRAELSENDKLVLREGHVSLGWTVDTEAEMVDKDALIESIGEVPVVVRVEIGFVELRAREWAALGAGDVLPLGRRVGEPVVLRVSGVEVARGELVEIDGEVGVRITRRTGASP